jgi:hypothetical protein
MGYIDWLRMSAESGVLMSRFRFVALSAVLVGCLCACGTSHSGTASTNSPQPNASSATSRSDLSTAPLSSAAAAGGPTAAALPALVIQAGDVAGYAGDGSAGPQTQADNDNTQTTQCVGEPDPNHYFLAGYASDEFSNDDVAIDSDITSYTTAQAIAIDRTLIGKADQLTVCIKQAVAGSGLPTGSTVDSVAITAPPVGAPSNVLGEIVSQVTIPGQGRLYNDEVLIVGKHVDEGLTFTSAQQIPTSLIQSLATTIANRIADK